MTTAATPPAGVAPPPDRLGSASRVRRWWAGVPLVARLVGILTVLLGTGLVLAGVTAATLLESSLVRQVDSKLESEGEELARSTVDALSRGFTGGMNPSDYYVRVQVGRQTLVEGIYRTTAIRYGTPNVPDLTAAQAQARVDHPFTVSSTRPDSDWRVAAQPVRTTGGTGGSIVVALPLGDIERTVDHMTIVLLLSGTGILLLGAGAGTWAVHRSLRPLRQIETTAAAIAAGELSRRVAAAPTTTEVGRLGAALNGMLAQIEHAFGARTASEARMRRFVADASHELRTPLATIRGYGELYRMGALIEREQLDDTMRRIEDSASRMGGLVEDLLSLARLDEGRPMDVGPVDLTALAADSVSDLHALDPTRTPRLVPLATDTLADQAPDACVVIGDEARVRQVLNNLVGNAARHTPPGTAVEIAVGLDGGNGVFEVRDHGPGIDPEHAARVFERFYRVDASRGRSSGGSGLGMAIVAAIIAAHDGSVDLFETPGGGTTVRVALPTAGPTHA
jgi:two-component system, OmpR family, sensor kinase